MGCFPFGLPLGLCYGLEAYRQPERISCAPRVELLGPAHHRGTQFPPSEAAPQGETKHNNWANPQVYLKNMPLTGVKRLMEMLKEKVPLPFPSTTTTVLCRLICVTPGYLGMATVIDLQTHASVFPGSSSCWAVRSQPCFSVTVTAGGDTLLGYLCPRKL